MYKSWCIIGSSKARRASTMGCQLDIEKVLHKKRISTANSPSDDKGRTNDIECPRSTCPLTAVTRTTVMDSD